MRGDTAYLPYMAKGCDSSVHMLLRSMGRVSMIAFFFQFFFIDCCCSDPWVAYL